MGWLLVAAAALRVSVVDPSGAVVPGAAVTAVCAGRAETVSANAGGVAEFAGGPCAVTVKKAGFAEWTVGAAQGDVTARLTVAVAPQRVDVKPRNPITRFKNWLTSCTRR